MSLLKVVFLLLIKIDFVSCIIPYSLHSEYVLVTENVSFLLQVTDLSFYDVLLDFVLLDAFDDLATPPYSVATAVQNRWLSARIKETVSNDCRNPVFVLHFLHCEIQHIKLFSEVSKPTNQTTNLLTNRSTD